MNELNILAVAFPAALGVLIFLKLAADEVHWAGLRLTTLELAEKKAAAEREEESDDDEIVLTPVRSK